MRFLDPLRGQSKTIFLIAALILILNNMAAAMNAFSEMATLGAALKEVLQVLGYGAAFIGGLALFVTLSQEGSWPARIAAPLEALGVMGTAILAIAYTLSLLGLLNTVPDPVQALGFGVLLGQLGLLLLGIAVLRSDAYPAVAGLALFLPFLIFAFSIAGAGIFGEDAVPAYVPFLTVTAQTVAHLAITFALPYEPATTGASQRPQASLARSE